MCARGICSEAYDPGHMLRGIWPGAYGPGKCSGAYALGHMLQGMCSGAFVPEHAPGLVLQHTYQYTLNTMYRAGIAQVSRRHSMHAYNT